MGPDFVAVCGATWQHIRETVNQDFSGGGKAGNQPIRVQYLGLW